MAENLYLCSLKWNDVESQGPIKIDVGAVLAGKLGAKARYVPRFAVRYLERLVCQEELNDLLATAYPRRGADFCEHVVERLGVTVDVRGAGNLPSDPRVIVASNHPLGGLDGICMIAWLYRHYGVAPRFVVNDILKVVEPLAECFVPVNKHGAQNRGDVSALDTAFESDAPVVVYPAGLVSRLQPDGTVADLEWHKMFINKAVEYHRPIVPVHFAAENSPSFYRFARRRKRLGIKFNIEMVLLPREVFRARGKRFVITCGHPVPWESLGDRRSAAARAAEIRRTVYSLPSEYNSSI